MEKENKSIRAFVCIEFPDKIVKEVARVQNLILNKKFIGKTTELENLHLTLKFLGEIDDETLRKVREILSSIKFGKFEAKLLRSGTFNHNGKPSIVWVKIGGKGIYELQEKIDSALSSMFEKEKRFMSHLTIARIKYVKDKQDFRAHVEKIPVKRISFPVESFKLKKSELNPLGPKYETIEEYFCED